MGKLQDKGSVVIKYIHSLVLIIALPLVLQAKIRHPITLPEFDDNDTVEFISLDSSVTNFFNNKGVLGAKPDSTGVAYNRYDFDLQIERNSYFAEFDIALITDKLVESPFMSFSENDLDIVLGKHLSENWDIYLEHEAYAPFNRSMKITFDGVGLRNNTTGYLWDNQYNFTIDIEKILRSSNFSSLEDGSGRVNTIYSLHFDYDLPQKFSLSLQHDFYTIDKNNTFCKKYTKPSEWDQIYQINYQFKDDIIVSIFHEVDSYVDHSLRKQQISGAQILYEF